jgi:septum site-determining protein MinD
MNASAGQARLAYLEAARRLAGETVTVAVPDQKKTFFTRLFGRRAA